MKQTHVLREFRISLRAIFVQIMAPDYADWYLKLACVLLPEYAASFGDEKGKDREELEKRRILSLVDRF